MFKKIKIIIFLNFCFIYKSLCEENVDWAKFKNFDELKITDFLLSNLNGIEAFDDVVDLGLRKCGIKSIDGLEYLIKLRKLSLFDNIITNIEPISDLINLQDVDFTQNRIKNISALEKLKSLRILSLENNQVEDVSILAKLTRLTSLRLSRNRIKFIDSIYFLTNLNGLDVSFNFINEIRFQNLTKLNFLNIDNNLIRNIESIFNLNTINYLYFSNNNVTNINFRKLNNLKELFAMNNNISNIDSISSATNLEKIYLSSNQIENVKPIESFRLLKELIIKKNRIKSINFKRLEKLELIDLSDNLLTDIESLNGLEFLKRANFSNNMIESKTNKSIFGSHKLLEINLSNNSLTSFILDAKLVKLSLLDLSFNRLNYIYKENNIQITNLYLNVNYLSDINQLNSFICIGHLDISNNFFETINISDIKLFSLIRKFKFDNNPIKSVLGIENLNRLKMIYIEKNQIILFQNITNSRVNSKRKRFLESLHINLISDDSNDEKYCQKIIYFLKKNIHFHLFYYEQIDFFLHNCKLSYI